VEKGWRPLSNAMDYVSEALGRRPILGKEARGAREEA